jgi:hypothetical protein
MAESLRQFEANLKNSFSYVKKDLIKVNEQINHLHEQIQHLSLNNVSLLGEIRRLEADVLSLNKGKPKKSTKKVKKSTKKGSKAKKKVVKETTTYS